jgi:5-methylthioadenosine/S-adenosylhomocysteine deaminase
VPFLEEIGFLGPDLLAVHCVRLTPEEIEILARYDVKISHNPISNMYLGSGAAPVVEMRRAGLTVGLGTDGAASNNSQDMIETCKCAGLVQKMVHRDPSAITATDVLDMATIDGARAIGQGERLGSLEPGKQADQEKPGSERGFAQHDIGNKGKAAADEQTCSMVEDKELAKICGAALCR